MFIVLNFEFMVYECSPSVTVLFWWSENNLQAVNLCSSPLCVQSGEQTQVLGLLWQLYLSTIFRATDTNFWLVCLPIDPQNALEIMMEAGQTGKVPELQLNNHDSSLRPRLTHANMLGLYTSWSGLPSFPSHKLHKRATQEATSSLEHRKTSHPLLSITYWLNPKVIFYLPYLLPLFQHTPFKKFLLKTSSISK